jgi:tyrosyl-tRNA synthetase
VTDTPEEVYGRTMSIPDEAMAEWYALVLGRPVPPTKGEGALSPRDAKRALARAIVERLHSAEDARQAERHFDRVVVEKEMPEEIEEASFAADGAPLHLPQLITEAFGLSRSEGRRLIDQGAVSLDDRALGAGEYDVDPEQADGSVLKVGRRRFRRLRRDG